MEVPQTVRRHCPTCKKHTEQKVRRQKVGAKNRRKMSIGERVMARKLAGYGGFPRPNPKGREKPTRKVDLRLKCEICKKEHTPGRGFRVKKFELVK